jgi:indole-3-glycerol phosphate synthase
MDFLATILDRKRREVARRLAHLGRCDAEPPPDPCKFERADRAYQALRRDGGRLKVIAEIKFRSPSAGVICERQPGKVAQIARTYQACGAAAVSVLCDYRGFNGTPLDVRRVSQAIALPLLFKEFVLDPIQIRLAQRLGAAMVLLVVRALTPGELQCLADEAERLGLAPVIEAANERELDRALATKARMIGINARDLTTFRVDGREASRLLASIPTDRIAIYMSGVSSRADLIRLDTSRADAVLIGESLMRAPHPGERLQEYIK